MHQCCVFGCRNQGNHTFPRDVRKLWEAAKPTRDNNVFIAKKYSKICAGHFKTEDYIKVGRFSGLVNIRRILKKGIVPSIFQCTKTEDVKSKQRLERAGVDGDSPSQDGPPQKATSRMAQGQHRYGYIGTGSSKKGSSLERGAPCEVLNSENATSLHAVHVAKDEDGMVTLELDIVKKEVIVKEEPPCEDLASKDITSLDGNHLVKEECLEQHGIVTLELDIVKKEVAVKEEPPSEEASEYTNMVKYELVLGPECQQRHAAADIVNTSACGQPPPVVVAAPREPTSERDCASVGPNTSTRKKPITSETCRKTFTRVRSLNIHKLIHTG